MAVDFFYRAPSWSWASVNGTIENNSLLGADDAISTQSLVLSAFTCDKGSGINGADIHYPFLRCTNGQLAIEGGFKRAKCRRSPEQRRMFYVGHRHMGNNSIREGKDLKPYASLSNDPKRPEAFELLDDSDNEIGCFLPDTTDDIPEHLFCLRIVVEPIHANKEDFNIPWATRGLALVLTANSDEYRRVGYFELTRTYGGITFPHSFEVRSRSTFHWRGDRYPSPNIDVAGFFKGCDNRIVTIV
jgi:hypothetical protein